MARDTGSETLTVAGRDVTVTNPGKVLFPEAGFTKLDLARYYLAVAPGALQAPEIGQTSWFAIPTASAAISSFRSARPSRGRRGWKSCR